MRDMEQSDEDVGDPASQGPAGPTTPRLVLEPPPLPPLPAPPSPPPPVPDPAAERSPLRRRAVVDRAAPTAWSRICHPSGSGYLRLSQTRGTVHWDVRATCKSHGCTLTRHADKADIPETSDLGRPVGFLWLFLEVADSFSSKAEHRDFEKWASKARRLDARRRFDLMDGSDAFTEVERRPRVGEGPEPDGIA